ncbi:DCN1-like protein 3 [Oscarella lobularis]|uniref:DCN1-like protein 3 n=1 Tax=Oscarella lobularis TaxID=121494 RepID=UPI003313990A
MGALLSHCVSSNDDATRSPDVAAQSTTSSHRGRVSPKQNGSRIHEKNAKSREANTVPDIKRSSPPTTESVEAKIGAYFARYKDPDEDRILAEGMERFCADLGVDPTEFVVLALAWTFEADEMCAFARNEFVGGCRRLGDVHSPETLRAKFPDVEREATGPRFRDFYRFTFGFGLDKSSGQRSLPLAIAVPLWQLVFSKRRDVIVLESWCAYLEANQVKGISRDTWNMFLPFALTIRDDFSNYDDSEAWPSLFDDFVEYQTSVRQ